MPCLVQQHLTPMTILSVERRHGIIEPWEHYHISLMMNSC